MNRLFLRLLLAAALAPTLLVAQPSRPSPSRAQGDPVMEWLLQGRREQRYAVYGTLGALGLSLLVLLGQWIRSARKVQDVRAEMEYVRATMEAQCAEVSSKAQTATDKARNKAMQLSTLFLKLKNLVGCTEKEELSRELMNILSKGFGATKCAFFMYDKAKDELFVMRAHGLTPTQVAGLTIKPGDGTLVGHSAEALKMLTADMVKRDNTLAGLKVNKPLSTFIVAPVISKDQLAGLIHIGELRDIEWTEVETQLFWTTCLLTGIALDRANLLEATKEELLTEKKVSSKSLEERKKMRGLLDKVVSPKIASQLLSSPENLHLEGQMKDMTVFFSDIKGFTSYSEGRQPTEVVGILNEYLTAMTEVVFQFGGTLDKFVGDAIVAHWGALPPDPEHAKLAVRAAFAMRGVLERLHEKWKSEGQEPLNMGMGVHTGEMLFGGVGSPQKIDFTVIGDNVNLCSRLESLTRRFDTDLIISEETYQRVKEIVRVKALGSLQVKGKQKPVTVYAVESVNMAI